MSSGNSWPGSLLDNISKTLREIDFESYFLLAILLLITICCVVRLVRMILILLSPNGYSRDHSGVIGRVSHIAFGFGIFFEALVWLFGASSALITLQSCDRFAAIFHFGLMALTLLLAGLNMLFKRRGKRVFIAQALCRSSIVLAIEGLILFVLSYFMVP